MDQSNFDSKKRLIEKKVNESFGQTTALDLKFVEKKKNEILHHSSCKVSIKNSRDIGEFQMILFNPTFEKCCQIVKRKDNDNAKINKIEKFIKQNKLKDFFSQVI